MQNMHLTTTAALSGHVRRTFGIPEHHQTIGYRAIRHIHVRKEHLAPRPLGYLAPVQTGARGADRRDQVGVRHDQTGGITRAFVIGFHVPRQYQPIPAGVIVAERPQVIRIEKL